MARGDGGSDCNVLLVPGPRLPEGRDVRPLTASWTLRLWVVEAAQQVLGDLGIGNYFVTVKPGVWSTYTDYRRGRIQFGERMVLYANNGRPFARMGGLRGREALLHHPPAKLAVLVLHECAHALTHRNYPRSRPHGREFYAMERGLLDRYLDRVALSVTSVPP